MKHSRSVIKTIVVGLVLGLGPLSVVGLARIGSKANRLEGRTVMASENRAAIDGVWIVLMAKGIDLSGYGDLTFQCPYLSESVCTRKSPFACLRGRFNETQQACVCRFGYAGDKCDQENTAKIDSDNYFGDANGDGDDGDDRGTATRVASLTVVFAMFAVLVLV